MTARQHAQYLPLPPHVDLPALDHEVIEFWNSNHVFGASIEARRGGEQWTFYEGPPTANGMPGTHHVEARAFKDVFPRFKTMQGRYVPRIAGWDCHGLPVELAVEKELGFTGKPDIEKYGIDKFNAHCRESVQRNVSAFTEMSERMGYWADYDNAYWTMNAQYVESVWWALKTIFEAGLLVQDHRVAPYCPRCGTTLSDHEVAQGYEDVTDASVYVRFPVLRGPLLERYPGVSLLIWTTTPWTLVSNTAAAVNAEVDYVVAETSEGELLIIAQALREAVLGADSQVLETVRGADLVGTSYRPPFDYLDFAAEAPDNRGPVHTVLAADFVTTEDGTGLVHEAPAFGAEDFALCKSAGLPVVNPIEGNGHFREGLPVVGGVFFKDADEVLIAQLRQQNLLFRHVPYTHSYPHCWRCHTPLMYYALPSWYIRTTAIKAQLLAQNDITNWFPATIKHGRYGDWLNNNIDWALSRDRYWGTPLPIWRNEADPSRLICVGSLAELGALAGQDLSSFDPHRPYVDDIAFTVAGEEGTYRRVPQVIDGWFDSGAMPFAQFGAPWRNDQQAQQAYPADFICEAIDQTRGWFYTLMAVGVLVKGASSYRNVLCLGHILAEDGRKMSKHLGNILEPIPLMERHGADALRWFMLAAGSPWSSRRVGHKALEEIASKVLRTYWSIASFQSLYARANSWTPGSGAGEATDLDRWARSEANAVLAQVTQALENFDSARAGKLLAGFIDDLSNWYVRRSRRRFWDGDPVALQTLHDCLELLTLMLAPIVPFVTEQVWRALFAQGAGVESVHLADWPAADEAAIDAPLGEQIALVRRLVELGRSARAESGVKTRQPLSAALISAPGWNELPAQLKAQVADELNVMTLSTLADADELVELSVKANFRALGKRFGKQTQIAANTIAATDAAELVAAHRAGAASIEIDGERHRLEADDLIITETPRSGWAVAGAGAETVALDLELTHELRQLGLLRDIVRLVQDARKSAGLEVTDRIELCWLVGGSEEPAQALRVHREQLAAEVLAVSINEGEPADAATFHADNDEELGLHLWLRRSA